MNETSVRFPAEWEAHDCILMAWPHRLTDWNYMLDEVRKCVADIVRAISRHECVLLVGPRAECLESVRQCGFNPARVRFLDVPTNDTWARDFGPLTVIDKDGNMSALDFKFNAWGLKFAADKDNLITPRLSVGGILNARYVNCQGYVLEGGSVESDGCGTLMTTAECLLSPNRNGGMTQAGIRLMLTQKFGVTHQLWLHHGAMSGDDTDSHIDTLARLAPGDTILYVGARDSQGVIDEELEAMRDELASFTTSAGQPYNLIELPLPDPIYDEDGMQLPATYANYLVGPTALYMPVYGQPMNDRRAIDTVRIAYPNHEIIALDCRALIKQHGSLHCITMQLPTGAVAGITAEGVWETALRNL